MSWRWRLGVSVAVNPHQSEEEKITEKALVMLRAQGSESAQPELITADIWRSALVSPAAKEPGLVLIEFVLTAPPTGHSPSARDRVQELGTETSQEPLCELQLNELKEAFNAVLGSAFILHKYCHTTCSGSTSDHAHAYYLCDDLLNKYSLFS